MKRAETLDVAEIIDRSPFGALQMRAVGLCVLIGMLDGYDIQVIAVVAPALSREWGVPVAAFGQVFGAGLVGLAVGALSLGPAGDRFGRKRTILLSTFIFGLFALLTAMSDTMRELTLFRFLTGLGLGGAMPNIITLTAEYSPKRLRATVITIMFCGLPVGLMLGGLAGAGLLEVFGWRSLFVLGGATPLLLLPILAKWLPESIRYLVMRNKAPAQVARTMRAIAPAAGFTSSDRFTINETPLEGLPVRLLFADGRALDTGLIWLAFFLNLLVMYFLVNWTPVLLMQLGFPQGTAIRSLAALNLGGVVGAIVLGRLLDRPNPYPILTAAYAAAAGGILAVTALNQSVAVTMLIIFVIGFGVIGAQIGMNAVTASLYPAAIRATGVGWALGIGRFGSIIGPTLGGVFLAASLEPATIFSTSAVPAASAALALLWLGRRQKAKLELDNASRQGDAP